MDDPVARRLVKPHTESESGTPGEDDRTETSIQQQSHVTVLTEEYIRGMMERDIQKVSDICFISEADATLLLPKFRRSVSRFHTEWFDDAKSVRKSVGLLERPLDQPSDDKEFFCGVCSKFHPLEKSASVSCGHRVCTCCWTRHISNIINEAPATEWDWRLKCPYSCPASVGRDMIDRFASEEDKSKYDRYLLKSYVEDSKTMILCPRVASGRSCAIDVSPADSGKSAVYCVCLLSFCWNCSKDVHSPVDCKSAAKWLAMNSSEFQDPNWILANTVSCPKCKRRIEEGQDFSLKMQCLPPCNYDFCWLCRSDWSEHGEGACDIDAVSYEEADQQWKTAELAADRYADYYENWKSNELLMEKAKAALQQSHAELIPNLSNTQLATVPQLQFIAEAWYQIMECRRVLKWTYAYGYYLREDEVEKQDFLKHKQVDGEIPLEKLFYYAQHELQKFLDAEGISEDFAQFKFTLTRLTSITRNHYERLVRELEDGLTNVVPASRPQRACSEDHASGSP
ncbi:unnamed protein product [Thlaspi arvense]|uniref:RBR-type E3 ubiquitin transferase n=1 Tax=Thlaspi arvense TaxID=13288 RepID=A0AAU9RDL6_THLAR|nr:unnamed protein product [Thlaspi arvense]